MLRAYELIIKDVVKDKNYPRAKDDFIEKVKMPQMKKLLQLLGLNTSNTAIPDSPLITVEVLYDHFLSGNPILMTIAGKGKVQQYWFK